MLQELLDKLVTQKYFNITYLGQIIRCSILVPDSFSPEINKIDMSNPDINQKTITLEVKVTTNYPIVNVHTEILNTQLISKFGNSVNLHNRDDVQNNLGEYTDKEFFGPPND